MLTALVSPRRPILKASSRKWPLAWRSCSCRWVHTWHVHGTREARACLKVRSYPARACPWSRRWAARPRRRRPAERSRAPPAAGRVAVAPVQRQATPGAAGAAAAAVAAAHSQRLVARLEAAAWRGRAAEAVSGASARWRRRTVGRPPRRARAPCAATRRWARLRSSSAQAARPAASASTYCASTHHRLTLALTPTLTLALTLTLSPSPSPSPSP